MTLIPAHLREAVVLRARNRCEYCRLGQDSQVATFPVDHIVPTCDLGVTELDNLALACPRCNATKWKHRESRDPESGEMVPLFNPRVQKWGDHFHWSDADSAVIEPVSAVGRATLVVLDLNSKQHVTIRGLLRVLGLHPPVEES